MTPLIRPMILVALAALPMLAQPGTHPGRRPGRVMRALDLSEAQRASIKAIHERRGPELAARRETARLAQASLREALQDPAVPEPRLRALHDKASAARFDLMLAARALHQEVQAVLTPEQRAKAADLRVADRDGWGSGMCRHRMGLPG